MIVVVVKLSNGIQECKSQRSLYYRVASHCRHLTQNNTHQFLFLLHFHWKSEKFIYDLLFKKKNNERNL